MADKIQRVIYRIIVESAAQNAAQIAKAKAELDALREAERRGGEHVAGNSERQTRAVRETTRAQRDLNRETERGNTLSTAFIRNFQQQVDAMHTARQAAERDTASRGRLPDTQFRDFQRQVDALQAARVAEAKQRQADIDANTRLHTQALNENTAREKAAARARGVIHAEALRENATRDRAASAVRNTDHTQALRMQVVHERAAQAQISALHAQALRENRDRDIRQSVGERLAQDRLRDRAWANSAQGGLFDEPDRPAETRQPTFHRLGPSASEEDRSRYRDDVTLSRREPVRPGGLTSVDERANEANRYRAALYRLRQGRTEANLADERANVLGREEVRTTTDRTRAMHILTEATRRNREGIAEELREVATRHTQDHEREQDIGEVRRQETVRDRLRRLRGRADDLVDIQGGVRDRTDRDRHRAARGPSPADMIRNTSSHFGDSISDQIQGNTNEHHKRFGYWKILLTAILYGLTALVPVIAVVVAALGAMYATLTVAVASVGVFALAAVGHIKTLQKVLKDAYVNAALVPAQFQGIAAAFDGLKKAYDSFQTATQAPVFSVLIDAMQLISGVLPKLVTLVERTGTGLRGALGVFDEGFKSDGFASFVAFLEVKTPRVLVSLGRSLRDIAAGLAGLAQSFGPYIDWFIKGLEGMARGFRNWATGLAASKAFKDFMAYARDSVPWVVNGLKALLGVLITFGVALAPAGKALLGLLIALNWLLGIKALIPFLQAFTLMLFTWLTISGIVRLVVLLGRGLFLLAGHMSTVTGRAVTMTAALRGVALATAAIAAGLFLWDAYKQKQQEAADAVEAHRQAVEDLAAELSSGGGVASEDFRKQQGRDLDKKVAGPGFFDALHGQTGSDTTIAEQLGRAGISRSTAVAGASGDDEARQRTLKGLRDYAVAQQKAGDEAGSQNAIRAAADYLNNTASAAEAAAASQEDWTTAINGANKALSIQQSAAQRDANLIGKLNEKTEQAQRIDAAVQAKITARDTAQQYTQAKRDYARAQVDVPLANRRAVQAVTDAELSLVEAQRRSRESQIALTQTRIHAADQLQDLQNKLRDVALDEEGSSIALARAQQNLRKVMADPLSTSLDRRQAILDAQRSKNDYDDTLTQGGRTRRDAAENERSIKASVMQAELDAKEAARGAKRAQDDLATAKLNVTRTFEDGQAALATGKQQVDDLAQKAQEAATNFAVLNAIANQTPASLQGVIDKHAELAAILEKGLSTKGLDDVIGRSKLVMTYLAAARLMENDPKLSPADAFAQAQAVTAAAATPSQYAEHAFGNAPSQVPTTKKKTTPAHGRTIGRHGASGGPVYGPGTRTSDDVPMWLSRDEHVWTAAEVAALGGHGRVQNLRNAALAGRFGSDDVDAVAAGFDPGSLYRGLSVTPQVRVPVGASAGAARTLTGGNNHSGLSVGDITINNPVAEPAGESLYRSVRRLAFEYES